MYWLASQEIKFTSRHKRVLRGTVFGEDGGPGTIVRDFEAMVSFFRQRDLPVTGMHQLKRRILPELNACLAHPIQLGLSKPLQKSYPHVNGLYLLVRASGLTYIDTAPKTPWLVVDDEMYQAWQSLNPTERYCTLLETWLLRGYPEIIGEHQRYWDFHVPEPFGDWVCLFRDVPDEGVQVAGNSEVESSLRYEPGWHNLGLLELFGLVTVQHGAPRQGEGWQIERVRRTPLGDALLALLHNEFFKDISNILPFRDERKVPPGVLQPVLQPYFPDWKNTLVVPEGAFREGTHVFKASWGWVWRRVAVPGDLPLDELASIILDAFEFAHDHLYMFSYQNRFGVTEKVYHPLLDLGDVGPRTDEVLVGKAPLRLGQTMTYLFDFGDQWEFDVTLEQVDPADMPIEGPTILEGRGEAPEQYPRWDGWE